MSVRRKEIQRVVAVTVGQKIKTLREEKYLSQEELGRRADVSTNTVSKIEQGRVRYPSRITLLRIAEALGVPVEELLVQEEEAAIVGKADAPTSKVQEPGHEVQEYIQFEGGVFAYVGDSPPNDVDEKDIPQVVREKSQ